MMIVMAIAIALDQPLYFLAARRPRRLLLVVSSSMLNAGMFRLARASPVNSPPLPRCVLVHGRCQCFAQLAL